MVARAYKLLQHELEQVEGKLAEHRTRRAQSHEEEWPPMLPQVRAHAGTRWLLKAVEGLDVRARECELHTSARLTAEAGATVEGVARSAKSARAHSLTTSWPASGSVRHISSSSGSATRLEASAAGWLSTSRTIWRSAAASLCKHRCACGPSPSVRLPLLGSSTFSRSVGRP